MICVLSTTLMTIIMHERLKNFRPNFEAARGAYDNLIRIFIQWFENIRWDFFLLKHGMRFGGD